MKNLQKLQSSLKTNQSSQSYYLNLKLHVILEHSGTHFLELISVLSSFHWQVLAAPLLFFSFYL